MLNPQFIVNEVLPAMQDALSANKILDEASRSAPNPDHFDPNNCVQAAPLICAPENTPTPTQTMAPDR